MIVLYSSSHPFRQVLGWYIERGYNNFIPVPFPNHNNIKKLKGINQYIFMRFQQNWSKQEIIHYFPRSMNLLILFEIRKNWMGHISFWSVLMMLFFWVKTLIP